MFDQYLPLRKLKSKLVFVFVPRSQDHRAILICNGGKKKKREEVKNLKSCCMFSALSQHPVSAETTQVPKFAVLGIIYAVT